MVRTMNRYAAVLALLAGAWALSRSDASAVESQQPTPTYLKTLIGNRGGKTTSLEDRKPDAELAATITGIRRAFEEGNARRLDSALHRDLRIRVSLQSRADEAGYFQRSQVMFMLDKLFDERETESFSFEPVEPDSADDTSAHVHAQWSYTVVGNDAEVTEHLRFKLLRRASDWYISEILTAPR